MKILKNELLEKSTNPFFYYTSTIYKVYILLWYVSEASRASI